MNEARRQQIAQAVEQLAGVEDTLQEALDTVRGAADEEQEYYSNMPETLQGGERGTRAEEAAQELADAADKLDTMLNDLADLVASLDNAKN